MSRTQYYCAASLDGYITKADDTLDWLLSYEGSFTGGGNVASQFADEGLLDEVL